MSKEIGAQLLALRDRMKRAARDAHRQSEGAPDIPRSLHLSEAETLDLFAIDLESIVYENGLAPGQQSQGERLAAGGKVPELLAARFCDLLVREARRRDVGLLSLAHEFDRQPRLMKELLASVAAQLIEDAREERESWSREYIAGEVERMRGEIATGPSGQLITIRDLSTPSAIPTGKARDEARDSVGAPQNWRPKGGES